nr:formate dehydrogenase accessory sulfurtransferase FdhD [Candidatus Njordarchaeota archaeon]
MKNIRKMKVTRVKENNFSVMEDEVIVDTFLSVSLNGEHLISFICSPGYEEEAAVGYLFSAGILKKIKSIEKLSREEYNVDIQTIEPIVMPKSRTTLITSACGVPDEWLKLRKGFEMPKVESDLKVNSNVITSAAKQLNERSEVFRRTGGTHAAALFRTDGELFFGVEDASRHVAVDKAVGKALLANQSLSELFLMSTGRLASDMVSKAVYAGIPIVASIAAPFDSGIQLAEATGITLIGFVRGQRMNIYTHPNRIMIG